MNQKLKLLINKNEFLMELNGTKIDNVVAYKIDSQSKGLVELELKLAYLPEEIELEITLD